MRERAVAEAALPAPPGWAERLHAAALSVELPAAVRLAELPLPLGDVLRWRTGDVLPLPRPQDATVVAGGMTVAQLPAAALFAQSAKEER